METPSINRDDLKGALERGDTIRLVMALNDWAFDRAHIPGSLRLSAVEQGLPAVEPQDEIVVYCSGPDCPISLAVARRLARQGYIRVRRYAGGLSDWAAAGYPLDGARAA
jgi:ArsR family transcriptional regulator